MSPVEVDFLLQLSLITRRGFQLRASLWVSSLAGLGFNLATSVMERKSKIARLHPSSAKSPRVLNRPLPLSLSPPTSSPYSCFQCGLHLIKTPASRSYKGTPST